MGAGSKVFDDVALGFVKFDAVQTASVGANQSLDLVPESYGEVFSSGVDALQEVDFFVEVFVVTEVDDLRFQVVLELAEIDNVTGFGVDVAEDSDFEQIV